MADIEFKPWPKIPRGRNMKVVITEKMDGTNACVIVQDGEVVGVQSRSRMIKPEDDNFGFAAWVEQNKEELVKLGNGYHYGEWVGPGIQKNPHKLEEKTFYSFNTMRPAETLPECVSQVAVLYEGALTPTIVDECMENLWKEQTELGRVPEGIIVYNITNKTFEKYTYANQDGKWKNT